MRAERKTRFGPLLIAAVVLTVALGPHLLPTSLKIAKTSWKGRMIVKDCGQFLFERCCTFGRKCNYVVIASMDCLTEECTSSHLARRFGVSFGKANAQAVATNGVRH